MSVPRENEDQIQLLPKENQTPSKETYGQQIQNALNTLEGEQGIYIVQRRKFKGCCTIKTFYMVLKMNEYEERLDEQKNHPLFRCEDTTPCFRKLFYPESCRPQQLDVKHYIYNQGDKLGASYVLSLNKAYKCTFLCFARPVLDVQLSEGLQKKLIGQIISPFNCCDKSVVVYDDKGEKLYTVKAAFDQWGMCCNCNCDPCKTIDFQLLDKDNNLLKTWVKKYRATCCECCSNPDWFKVKFPPNSTAIQKTLLMSAAFYINFLFFDSSESEEKTTISGSTGGRR